MSQFKKDNNLMNGKGEDDVQWITVNGSHIPLKDGETPKQAIKEEFGNNTIKKDQKTKSLGEQVDAVLNGSYKDSHITMLENTPDILKSIGVPDKPFLMTSKHVYLAINNNGKYSGANDHYHDLGKDTFLKIPLLLKSPALVFKNHNTKNEIIAVVNAVDKNKKPIIVPIKLDATGSQNHIIIDTNLIKSAYGKNDLQNYINNNVNQEDILLIENKKIRDINQK